MILIAVLVAIPLLIAIAVWRRSRPAPAGQIAPRTARAAERFAAVEIRRRNGACAAARALDGQRFLANQSPALPLAGCTRTRCDCAFAKRSDRRGEDRRFTLGGLSAAMFVKSERRKRAGRREAD